MWRGGLFGILCAVALLAGASTARAEDALPPSLADQAARLLPAVVNIQTIATTPEGRMYFDGSGFIVDPSGLIVTNRHVIAGAYDITVTVPGIGKFKAKPQFISALIDLALLKIDAGQKLPTVKLGDSDTVRVGDRVMLMGNPLGVGESISFGVVSALNRDIGESMFDHFIQTDAALNHGNSGGPMFNMKGEVIGIDTGLTSSPGNTGSVGIGYAMPINDAKFGLTQWQRTGHVVVGWSGVRAQRVTDDLAAAFGLPRAEGAIITWVDPQGPAAGKIEVGDIILKLGDLDASDTRAAARLIAASPPGRQIPVTLRRHGKVQTVTVTVGRLDRPVQEGHSFLGRAPEQVAMVATPSDPGIKLAPIDAAMRRHFGLPVDQQGVAVTSVNPHGVASERKIEVGDVILSVGGRPVSTPADVQQGLRDVVARHMDFAALLISGARNTHWVALPVEADR